MSLDESSLRKVDGFLDTEEAPCVEADVEIGNLDSEVLRGATAAWSALDGGWSADWFHATAASWVPAAAGQEEEATGRTLDERLTVRGTAVTDGSPRLTTVAAGRGCTGGGPTA